MRQSQILSLLIFWHQNFHLCRISITSVELCFRWNRKNRRTVRYICKSQFMFWLIITLVFLNTIIQVILELAQLTKKNIVFSSTFSLPGDGASSPARVVGRVPGVHQPHLPLPLHPRDAHEDVRNVILGEGLSTIAYILLVLDCF